MNAWDNQPIAHCYIQHRLTKETLIKTWRARNLWKKSGHHVLSLFGSSGLGNWLQRSPNLANPFQLPKIRLQELFVGVLLCSCSCKTARMHLWTEHRLPIGAPIQPVGPPRCVLVWTLGGRSGMFQLCLKLNEVGNKSTNNQYVH